MQNIQPIYSPMPNHIEKREISALNNMFGCTPVGLITAKYKDKSKVNKINLILIKKIGKAFYSRDVNLNKIIKILN